MLVEWNDDLSIGVLQIDVQHKLLFDKFNSFVDAYQAHRGTEEIFRLFWFLEAYAVTHFKDEEKLMQEVRFPNYLAHRDKHLAFADQICKLKERLRIEGPNESLISTMASFITGWLSDHISTMDRAIAMYVENSKTSL